MNNFLITSLIASVVLTLLLNLLPMLFPQTARKAERKIVDKVEELHRNEDAGNRPRIRVYFPWKAMLLISVVLTVMVNLVGFMAR